MSESRDRSPPLDRRRFLGLSAGAGVGGLVAGVDGVAAQPGFDGWFEDVTNYSEVVDERGASEVTVTVGVQQGAGPFGFGPPAIQVDPGTTVAWEWNGAGGQHNVVHLEGNYQSDLYTEAGTHFSHTFESEGVSKYYCDPHRQIGMKGAVVVGDIPSGGSGGSSTADLLTLAAGGLLGIGLVLLPVAASRRSNSD